MNEQLVVESLGVVAEDINLRKERAKTKVLGLVFLLAEKGEFSNNKVMRLMRSLKKTCFWNSNDYFLDIDLVPEIYGEEKVSEFEVRYSIRHPEDEGPEDSPIYGLVIPERFGELGSEMKEGDRKEQKQWERRQLTAFLKACYKMRERNNNFSSSRQRNWRSFEADFNARLAKKGGIEALLEKLLLFE